MNNIQPLYHLTLMLICLFFFITQFPALSRCCHDYERHALLSFKFSLSDPSNRLSSWQQGSQNCCAWHGVECSYDSFHVITLDIRNTIGETYLGKLTPVTDFTPSARLNGTISPSLFNLTHLQYLDLSFNDFQYSQIPYWFANLKKLTHLDLSNSGFSGSITTQFANLSSLSYLDLSCLSFEIRHIDGLQSRVYSINGALRTSTNWLRGLVNLKVLRLNGVDLYDVSSTDKNWAKPISYLSNLRELELSGCNICGTNPINDQFLNLSRLTSLKMNGNYNLQDSPILVHLANLTSLSFLDLSSCNFKGSLPYLPQLKQLDVSYNRDLTVDLSGMIQHWLKLHTLSISYTHVIPSVLSSISNTSSSSLVNLFAQDCSIQGSFPSSISNLAQLKYLDFSENEITGQLPSSISNLSQLKFLDLAKNQITGQLPSSISNLAQLKYLDFSENQITGQLPSSISNLAQLRYLDLSKNKITGQLPSSISSLSLLRHLDLSENQITGQLPLSISNLRNLEVMSFNENNFQGTVPESLICEITTLKQIDLTGNNLTGPIPSCVTNKLENLRSFEMSSLKLRSCNLEGYIPAFICNFVDLYSLDFSHNNLIGGIPFCLFKLPYLFEIDLSENNLEGTLPHSLHFYNMMNLSNNNLQGPLPLPPQNIDLFDLSQNNFTGGISIEVGKRLSNVRVVSLSGNKLSGSIPFSLCSSKHERDGFSIESLDLSNNQLLGTIPSSKDLSAVGYCFVDILIFNQSTSERDGIIERYKSRLGKYSL